jgi:adenylate kinase family enzyme
MHIIINLFGGPGSGKSTTAAGLFHKLKLIGVKTELVTEVAKDLTWEQRYKTLENQFYVTAKQHHKIWRVLKYYEDHGIHDSIIITDSPIILGLLYNKNNSYSYQFFNNFVLTEFIQISPFQTMNLNVFLERVKKYDKHGRNQTEEEARRIDDDIYDLLSYYDFDFIEIPGDENAPNEIIKNLNQKFNLDIKV